MEFYALVILTPRFLALFRTFGWKCTKCSCLTPDEILFPLRNSERCFVYTPNFFWTPRSIAPFSPIQKGGTVEALPKTGYYSGLKRIIFICYCVHTNGINKPTWNIIYSYNSMMFLTLNEVKDSQNHNVAKYFDQTK